MSITISIPTPLRVYTQNKKKVVVEATSVDLAISDLISQFPKLGTHLLENGKLRTFVNLYLNSEDIRYLDKDITSNLSDGDELSIIPAIAGGKL